jgi:hypothetical protein
MDVFGGHFCERKLEYPDEHPHVQVGDQPYPLANDTGSGNKALHFRMGATTISEVKEIFQPLV